MRSLLAVASLVLLLAGCHSVPPLEDWERFKVSCRVSDKPGECIVKVQAVNPPPPPIGRVLVVSEPQIVEGAVVVEIKGWRGKRQDAELEQVVEVKVGVRPNIPFVFVLRDRGHEDRYKVLVPSSGEPTIEPAAGEFSERG